MSLAILLNLKGNKHFFFFFKRKNKSLTIPMKSFVRKKNVSSLCLPLWSKKQVREGIEKKKDKNKNSKCCSVQCLS